MSENENTQGTAASRRAVVGGFMGLGIATPLLAACGSDEEDGGSGGSSGSGTGDTGSSGGGTTSTGAIAQTGDVPVGSGTILKGEKVVLTQPTQGEFKAFSSICTHQQCPVTKIEGEDIMCTCHGSTFSIADGSVTNGPADKPLTEMKVTVTGQDISVA